MNQKLIHVSLLGVIPLFIILFTGGIDTVQLTNVYADAGSGTCVNSCTPPTLGVDKRGRQLVDDGFTINGQSFDVDYFSQKIPTQTFKVNEQIQIDLQIYEKGGSGKLAHTSLVISGDERKYVGNPPQALIEWNKDVSGVETVDVQDKFNMIDKVNVIVVEDPDNPNMILMTLQFQVTTPLDKSTISVNMWDQDRTSKNNHFVDALRVVQ